MMTTLKDIISYAIDVPLMDIKNISNIILSYSPPNHMYYLFHSNKRATTFFFEAYILASSPKEAWILFINELNKLKKKKINYRNIIEVHRSHIKYNIHKSDFMKKVYKLSDKPYYTPSKIQSIHIHTSETEYVYRYERLTKKVERKKTIERYDNYYGYSGDDSITYILIENNF